MLLRKWLMDSINHLNCSIYKFCYAHTSIYHCNPNKRIRERHTHTEDTQREENMNKLAVFVVVSFVLVSSLLNLSQSKAILIFLSNLSFVLSLQFYRKSWTVDYSNDLYISTSVCKNNVSIFISWIWFYRWWSASLPRTDYCTRHMCPVRNTE